MKNSTRSHGFAGFTIHEMLVTMGLVGFIVAVGFACLVTLQRGFAYLSAWSDIRANQVRLIDTMAIDLRTAYSVRATTSGTLSTLPLTITLLQGYSSYSGSGFRAGEPALSGSIINNPSVNSSNLLVLGGTATVTYSSSTSGSTKIISRTISWLESGSRSATREIATFSSNMNVFFQNAQGGAYTNNASITVNVTDQFTERRRTVSSNMSDTIFLRPQEYLKIK